MAAQVKQAKEMTVGKTTIMVEPGKQEVIVTRLFEAPRESLFKAMTDPQLIPQWWGPKYLTTGVEKLEAKPGGAWRFVQQDASGEQYAFHGVFHGIVSPAQMVMTFEYEGEPGHVSLQTTTLEDVGGKTLLREHTVFQSVADRDGMAQAGMEVGIHDSMERLTALVATM
jgi:uncharacterized protein YndB with AHSA1/START domain